MYGRANKTEQYMIGGGYRPALTADAIRELNQR